MTIERKVTLWVVLALLCASIASAKGDKRSTRSLSLEGKDWSLLIDLPRFKIDEEQTRPDGSGTMIQASNRKTDLVVSVFLERAPASFASVSDCKSHYWAQASQSPIPKSDILHSSTESMEVVQYMVEGFQGIPIMQKNVNAYMYREGVCIDIHLSKIAFESAEYREFEAVLDSVRYSDE